MMLSLFAVGTSLSSKTYGVDISSNGSETTLSQPTFHPSSGQVFGRAMDVTAIKRVDVDDNNKCMSIKN